jgi:signal transduction histidine kinase
MGRGTQRITYPHSLFERAVEWVDRRWPRRGLEIYLVVSWVICALTSVMAVVTYTRYFDSSRAEFWRMLGVLELAVTASFLVATRQFLRSVAPLRAWVKAERRPQPTPELMTLVSRGPYTYVLVFGAWVAGISVPVVVTYIALSEGLTLPDALVAGAGFLIGTLFLAILGMFGAEAGGRPLLREIASRLPGTTPPPAGLSVTGKVFVGALGLSLTSSFFAGSLATGRGSGIVGLERVIGFSLLVALSAALLAAILYSEVILGPVRELGRATRRVRAGDLGAHVTVVSDDEFGRLSSSFNEMVDGLAERESLREANVEQAQELRASRARIVAAADEGRRRVERDLHDGAQQHLVLLRLKLGQLVEAAEGSPQATSLASELLEDVGRALDELRNLAHGIYPALLEHEGLPGALGEAAEAAPISASLECNGTGRYPRELEAAVYFCCLEALQNAAKHAGEGARAGVRLAERDGTLEFEISDDGRGFDVSAETLTAGLQNMADRVGALGGSLQIDAEPGRGTRVTGTVPLMEAG